MTATPSGRVSGRLLLAVFGTLALLLLGAAGPAQAAGPALSVTATHSPDTFQRQDTADQFTATITNTGDADTSGDITVTDVLPAGVKLRRIDLGPFTCPSVQAINAGAPLTCTAGPLAAGASGSLSLTVVTSADAPDTMTNSVTVSGGGADSASASEAVSVVDRPAFGVSTFTARSLDAANDDYTVAGGHPDHASTTFTFPTYTSSTGPQGLSPVEDVKNIFTELPPGFVGNAAATPRCSLANLQAIIPLCPPGSKVGTLLLSTKGASGFPLGVYNMVPEHGYPAEFAFKFSANAVVMYPKVMPRTGQYGLMVTVPGVSRLAVTGVAVTFYGVPAQQNFSGGDPVPFLSNQSDCLVAQPAARIIVDSWQHSGRKRADGSPDLTDDRWKTATAPAPPVTGCDAAALMSQFAPTIDAAPTPGTGSRQADAPSGYTVDLAFPQTNDPTDPATTFDPSVPQAPSLKDATVTLPAGVAISPSAGDGLDGCSDIPGPGDQVRIDTVLPVSCPDASKIGTVVATSPLLAAHDPDTDEITGAESLEGDVYVIKPHPGDLSPAGNADGKFRLLIQLQNDRYGLNVKVPGVVTADKSTGRLTARFEDNPQLPVKTLSLTFKAGDRAPLVNPPTCAAGATTTGVFTPWSRGGTRSDGLAVLGTPDTTATSAFDVSWDGHGAACPATLPFAPAVKAGLVDRAAGGSSPFTFDLTREDRQDVINGLNVTLPGGLLAAVKDVPLCSDADANAGSCPAGSRVGSATVAAGPGGHPFYITDQPVSLTGPYKGAPYGLAIAVRAVAGPFDLGTVVVRQALNVDPDDTHVTVVSDPLPTIRDGVPLRVRRIHVNVNRPGFMRSPTSCNEKSIGSTVSSLGGQSVNLTAPFQVANCDQVPFAPKLAMRLTSASETKVGGHPGVEALVTQQPGEAAMTSSARARAANPQANMSDGAHPALTAVVTQQPGQANLKSATVMLPLSMALDPDNAQALCEYEAGLKNQCPASSIVGNAVAESPLLKRPLTGPVYFVKGVRFNAKGDAIRTLPTLLLDLNGEIHVTVRATSSVPDGKHLVTTFPLVPDAAISKFTLNINGGNHGILVVTHDQNLCSGPQDGFASFVGQNGKRTDAAQRLSTPDCALAVSRSFGKTKAKLKVTGFTGPGKITVSGRGIKTARRTIKSDTTAATLITKLTAKGRQMRKAKHDIRVRVSFMPSNGAKTRVAYSAKPVKHAKKKAKNKT